MNATDELRRLLDEHGIEYCGGEIMTYTDDAEYMPSENNTFDVTLYHLTPEQAVDATLGRGTCEVVSKLLIEGEYVPAEYYEFEMECGEGFKWDESEPPRYCPNCGRKVVDA